MSDVHQGEGCKRTPNKLSVVDRAAHCPRYDGLKSIVILVTAAQIMRSDLGVRNGHILLIILNDTGSSERCLWCAIEVGTASQGDRPHPEVGVVGCHGICFDNDMVALT